jgi:carbamoyltransferase
MSNILGVKLTHDAAVALIADGELAFSIELEKLNNNPRHSAVDTFRQIDEILEDEDIHPLTIDAVAIDGWKYGRSLQPKRVELAPYHEGDAREGLPPWGNVLRSFQTYIPLSGVDAADYVSFTHVAGHLVGSYAMSPWAKDCEPCYAIMWDGGTGARLYFINPMAQAVEFVGHLHFYYGMIYGIMGYYAGPFATDTFRNGPRLGDYDNLFGARDWPGKLMSWIALGSVYPQLLSDCQLINVDIEHAERTRPRFLRDAYNQNGVNEHAFMRAVMKAAHRYNLPDEDILATVHYFLEELLVMRANEATPSGYPLIFTGGSALNIKWNSALRENGHFREVFVSPCPNDSGSAIGAAACYRAVVERKWDMSWDVFSGPELKNSRIQNGWIASARSIEEVASELEREPSEPVVVLQGRAEIGPRALGARSIIMNPDFVGAQAHLNGIKGRESWRPVAPIALEREAWKYFMPGTRDPYMLFDHKVMTAWTDRLAEVTHLDGTARLETVGEDNPIMFRLLTAFAKITNDIPVLINTSANYNGSGFFPDVESAMRWGRVRKIWSEGILYWKPNEAEA